MKRVYVKPTIEYEAFVPNEYVAACGDIDYIIFTCGYCFQGKKIDFIENNPEEVIYVAGGEYYIDRQCNPSGPDGPATDPGGTVLLYPSTEPAAVQSSYLAGKCTTDYGGVLQPITFNVS